MKNLMYIADRMPAVKDRLDYVTNKTEEATIKVLNSADILPPAVRSLQQAAGEIKTLVNEYSGRFMVSSSADALHASKLNAAIESQLNEINKQLSAIKISYQEILQSQEFQDLTGQVTKQIYGLLNEIETGALSSLNDYTPAANDITGYLSGPKIKDGQPQLSQQEIDDLLSQSGF